MKQISGILGLLIFICVVTAYWGEGFLGAFNLENLVRRTALFGIISIGAAFVIMTSGIDLSIGSVVCLVGCLLPHLLVQHGIPVVGAVGIVMLISLAIGLLHGYLITKMKLQPFIVTLCGLLFYRGLSRGILKDQSQGFENGFTGFRQIAQGQLAIPGMELGIPYVCLILLAVALVAMIFLNFTVYGRYILALGRNEDAAKFSGINTDAMIILSYVICAMLSGFGGMLFVLDIGSAQPVDFGNFYELYAIAAAVLGGCSLRGGEGTIVGVIIGAAVMQALRNSINLIDWIPTSIEFAVIGVVILGGVLADELFKRYGMRKRTG